MSVDFSIVFPSRERLPMLTRLLDSLRDTTVRQDRLEVWIAFDWCDTPSVKSISALSREYPFARFYVTDRQENFSVGYYNRLCVQVSSGRYVQALNDDVVFKTPGWDRLALAVLDEYKSRQPDNVVYGLSDDLCGYDYACFPVLSREALNLLGWMFHPEFTTWGADIHLYNVMREVDRIVKLPYVVEHISHHANKRERDTLNYRIQNLARYNYASAPGEANRLRNLLADLKP